MEEYKIGSVNPQSAAIMPQPQKGIMPHMTHTVISVPKPNSTPPLQTPTAPTATAKSIEHTQRALAIGVDRGKFRGGKRRYDILCHPFSKASDHLIIMARHPPSGVKMVDSFDTAFKIAKNATGYAPSKELKDSIASTDRMDVNPVQNNGISVRRKFITQKKVRVTVHKNPASDRDSDLIPPLGAVFPLR